eukprot:1696561-Amphidinium_carterae.2
MNAPTSHIHVLSWTAGKIWIESLTGVDRPVDGSNDAKFGVTIPLQRGVISFPANRRHALCVDGDALCRLGFPVTPQQAQLMGARADPLLISDDGEQQPESFGLTVQRIN